jgi:hypothetical protein
MTGYLSHWDLNDKPEPARPSAASLSDVDADDLVKAAREALTQPSDFGYYGSRPLFESWGFVFFQSAASDTLERSNFRTALAELQGRATHDDGDQATDATDYVQTVGFSHWLVGSADHLAVRVLVDEDGPVEADNLTFTFVHAAELAIFLHDDHPVLDESDWSELQSEEQDAVWDAYLGSEVLSEITEFYGVDDVAELELNDPHTLFDGWTRIGELFGDGDNAETVRSAYYQHESTEWIEEGTSFYNGRHDLVMNDILHLLFVPRAQQIESAHTAALRVNTALVTGPNQTLLL